MIIVSPTLEEFIYQLPDERIAKYPVEPRDHSKLLYYASGNITHQRFYELPELIDSGSVLVFNDTKVIPARLRFKKDQGANIELLLLQPANSLPDYALAMQQTKSSKWTCMVGNKKRWPEGKALLSHIQSNNIELIIKAEWENRHENNVNLTWKPEELSFSEVLQLSGDTPLPPYLGRDSQASDKTQYQTIYARNEGAVAAPTAGLHFTDAVFTRLKQRDVAMAYVTLHVSAGTFQPVKVKDVVQHSMHSEQIIVSRDLIKQILDCKSKVLAVGTTSMRTLESTYWYGVLLDEDTSAPFFIPKLYPYDHSVKKLSLEKSMENILKRMDASKVDRLTGTTEIFIFPGYKFKVCDGLITNFHQPGSTLMMLIAAFVGHDWKKIYQEALDHSYRFLSYGDSSLLLP